MTFDMEATFGDDYLYFYEESIDDEHSDEDAAEILGLLQLSPGARILDAPCGHGRLSRRLAAAGMVVTGIDLSVEYLALAAELAPSGARQRSPDHLRPGDMRRLPVPGPFEAVVCWFNSFGYFDDPDCPRRNPGPIPAGAGPRRHPAGVETLHHDAVVRDYAEAPDATVLARRDDNALVDVSEFNPVTGRLQTQPLRLPQLGRPGHSAHEIPRLPTPPEWTKWLQGSGFSDGAVLGRRRGTARVGQLGHGGAGHSLIAR